jgi:hypothetical protein
LVDRRKLQDLAKAYRQSAEETINLCVQKGYQARSPVWDSVVSLLRSEESAAQVGLWFTQGRAISKDLQDMVGDDLIVGYFIEKFIVNLNNRCAVLLPTELANLAGIVIRQLAILQEIPTALASLQSRLDKIPPPAVLNIRGPLQHQAEVDTNILPLWQVVVENTQAESIAKNVRVSIDNPNPKIIMSFPMNLHLMHDNNKPFQKCHDIRYGDPLTFDLFACGQVDPEMYYIYRSDGDESEQIGPEWMLSSEDNDIISPAVHHPGGWRFDVRAVPDPPASPAHQAFCLPNQLSHGIPESETTLFEIQKAPLDIATERDSCYCWQY